MATNVVAIVGSLRAGSWNRRVLQLLQTAGAERGLELQLVELHGVPPYDDDLEAAGEPPPVSALKDRLRAADAVVVDTPQYNGGISGVVKNALDWISRPVLAGPLLFKPVGVVSVTTGRTEPVEPARQAATTAAICGATVHEHHLTIRSIGHRHEDETGFAPVVLDAATAWIEGFEAFVRQARVPQ